MQRQTDPSLFRLRLSPRATVTVMGQEPDRMRHIWQYSQGALRLHVHLSPSSSEDEVRKGLVEIVA